MLLSGTIAIRNAILYDYPFRQACESAIPVCDEFVIVCAPSTDGTEALCDEIADSHPGIVRVVYNDWWHLEHKQEALGDGARVGIENCQGEWCFYIQADECLHEDDVAAIRLAAENPSGNWCVWGHIDFWRSYEQYLNHGSHLRRARMLRRACWPSIHVAGDGATLSGPAATMRDMASSVRLFHYGSVRHPRAFLLKQRSIAELSGNPTWVASIDEVLENHETYHLPEQPPGVCTPFTGTHPKLMHGWMVGREEVLRTGKIVDAP